MASSVTVIQQRLEKIQPQMMKAGANALRKSLIETVRRIRKNRLSSTAYGTPGQMLSRSGTLRRSGDAHAGTRGSEIWGNVQFSAMYAAIQEFGGTVTPKGHPYLTIPLTAAMTPMGAKRGGIRSFPDVVFEIVRTPFVDAFSGMTIKKGRLVAFQIRRERQRRVRKQDGSFEEVGRQYSKKIGGDPLKDRMETGELIPLFLLQHKSVIKPKFYVRDQLKDDEKEILDAVGAAVSAPLRRLMPTQPIIIEKGKANP